MATCRDIIKRALRRIGVVAAGHEPTATQAAEGIVELQNLYVELAGQGVFGRLYDVLITDATYTAFEQDRVIAQQNITVELPDTITQERPWDTYPNSWPVSSNGGGTYDYGFWYSCQPRPPRDQSIVVVANQCGDCTAMYVYDATAAKWQQITALALETTAPLSARYAGALQALLAARLSDGYGQAISPQLQSEVTAGRSMMSHKWDRPRNQVVAEYM